MADNDENDATPQIAQDNGPSGATLHLSSKGRKKKNSSNNKSDASSNDTNNDQSQPPQRGRSETNNKPNFFRSLSRSLSRSRGSSGGYNELEDDDREIIITVTSCRSAIQLV